MEIASSIDYGDRAQHLQSRPKRKLQKNTTVFSVRHHPSLTTNTLRETILDLDLPFLSMVARPRPISTQDLLVRAMTPGRTKFHIPRRQDPGNMLPNHSTTAAATLPSLPPPQVQEQKQVHQQSYLPLSFPPCLLPPSPLCHILTWRHSTSSVARCSIIDIWLD